MELAGSNCVMRFEVSNIEKLELLWLVASSNCYASLVLSKRPCPFTTRLSCCQKLRFDFVRSVERSVTTHRKHGVFGDENNNSIEVRLA